MRYTKEKVDSIKKYERELEINRKCQKKYREKTEINLEFIKRNIIKNGKRKMDIKVKKLGLKNIHIKLKHKN